MPVIVDVPDDLTKQETEPTLPPGELAGEDVLSLIDELRAWGRLAWCRVEKIGNLGPGADATAACAKVEQ